LRRRQRALLWEGCCNIRDLGGLPTEDGGETRFGVVVRADDVTLLSPAGWEALASYGVHRIVDLRHDGELAAGSPHGDGIEVVPAPLVRDPAVFAEIDALLAGIDDPAEWRRRNYLWILDRFAANFARAVTTVARTEDGVTLVHCAGGVDRTGLVVALILRVAGVGVETIAADYAESEANWAPFVDDWIDAAPDEAERRKRRLLSFMPARAMHDVLVALEREHGSAEDYLLRAGIDRDDLVRIRARLRG
jgi:protein-tyrosine phosphatase